METTITYRNIVNATVHADNLTDESRLYDIEADLFVRSDRVTSISGGIVTDRTVGERLGSFGENTDRSLNLSVAGTDAQRRVAVLEAVSAFCAAARFDASLHITVENITGLK